MEAEGRVVPKVVKDMLASGRTSFYERVDGNRTFYGGGVHRVPQSHEQIFLDDLRANGREIASNVSASILDLGDGVACLEFHSKVNALDDGVALGILDGSWVRLDSIGGKEFLELMAHKLTTIIKGAVEGSGVTTEPVRVEELSDVLGKERDSRDKFNEASGFIHDCKSPYFFSGDSVGLFKADGPWSNHINMDMCPRISRVVSGKRDFPIFLWRSDFRSLACVASFDMMGDSCIDARPIEVLLDSCRHAGFPGMKEHLMIPG
jgi:hypothetical protein